MITRVHIRIYTIEELCYYICNNLYLIDYTLMNRQLCEWIREELHMWELADQLLGQMEKNCTAEQFVLTILEKSNVYSLCEVNKVQNMLEKLQNQKDVERAKHKADSLLASKEYALAVLVYQSIVKNEWDDSVDKSFYGKVYGCLGTAYGQQFLYEEAAAAYKEAYRLSEDPEMLKAYMSVSYTHLDVYKRQELWQYESALFYSDEDVIRAYMLRKLNVAGAENGQLCVTVGEVASAERREMEAMYPVLGEMEPKSADDNFKAFIQNIFEKKVVSSVFLTGEGFEKNWYPDSLRVDVYKRQETVCYDKLRKGAEHG